MERESREFLTFVTTVLAVGLAVLWFFIAGLATLFGSSTAVGNFKAWGLPDWARFPVGAIEVIGALALLVPIASFPAALALTGLTVVQIVTALHHGEPPWPAPVALAALAFIADRFRPGRVNKIFAEDPGQLS